MQSPHQIFFKLHAYYQKMNKINGFATHISTKNSISNLLLYNFVKTPLYNHYLVFSQPSLTEQFEDRALQELTLRFAQLHVSCVDKYAQNGYTLDNQFDSASLPQIDAFFNHSLQMLNTSLGNVDLLRSEQILPLVSHFFTLIIQEYQFIEDFCNYLQLNIQDFSNMVHRVSDQTKKLTENQLDVDERSNIIFELFQTIIFMGVPFIVGYESFAWIPRELAEIFQFEKSLVENYVQLINSKISPTETMPLGTWFNANQTAMVQNPPYNDELSLIDTIFTQALTSASELYNYSQLGQYATYIQARFEVEIGTAVIIIGKFYNPTINQWINAQNFNNVSEIMVIGYTPLNDLIHSKNQVVNTPLLDEEPPADLIFAETAGDFNSSPKLEEINRILSILKGQIK